MADVNKFSFARLNNQNWQIWKFRIEMLLTREELWYVIGDPKPEVVTAQWTKDDRKARATIGLCIDDNQFALVKTADSAKAFWDQLRTYHEKNTVTSRVSLLKKLCSLNLEEGGDLESHLMVLEDLFERLTNAGQELQESLRIAMILRSLPDSYGGLVTALESRPDADITMQLVKSKLLDEFERRNERFGESRLEMSEVKAMKSATVNGAGASKWVCFFCGKPGHLQRYCRLYLAKRKEVEEEQKMKPGEEKKKPEDNSSAKQTAKQVKNAAAGVCFMAGFGQQESWFVDSGASRHMTGDRNFFKSLKPMNGSSVMLANGKCAATAGCGEGIVHGYDGNGNVIDVKLCDVLYVPSLTNGLVSVDRLTAKGFNVNFKKNGCTICDASGKVVVVGEQSGCLYKLKLQHKSYSRDARLHGVLAQKKTDGDGICAEVQWYSEVEPAIADEHASSSERNEEDEDYFDPDTSSEEADPLVVNEEEYLSASSEEDSEGIRRSKRRTRGVRPSHLSDYVVGIAMICSTME